MLMMVVQVHDAEVHDVVRRLQAGSGPSKLQLSTQRY